MPRVAEFFGICISIYAGDHNPPHVHVFYAEFEAMVAIDDGRVLRSRVPATQLRTAQDWIQQNRATLEDKWRALNP